WAVTVTVKDWVSYTDVFNNWSPTMAFIMIYVMLFFSIHQAIQSTSVSTCPDDYSTIINGQCLAVIRNDPKIQKDAEIACNRRAGTLAIPRDPQGLWDYCKQQNYKAGVGMWVGASDAKEEGEWRWSNGELLPADFPWARGEPNNAGGAEHFLTIGIVGYYDYIGSSTSYYICEPQDKSAVATTTEGPFLTEITQMATNSSVSSPGILVCVNNASIFIIVLAICLLFTIILSVTLGVLLKRAKALHQNCPTQAHHQPN
ncbi:unnamed protein product, partial [Meganyctiphanes norvegica]